MTVYVVSWHSSLHGPTFVAVFKTREQAKAICKTWEYQITEHRLEDK
jgi:hypothetical protein